MYRDGVEWGPNFLHHRIETVHVIGRIIDGTHGTIGFHQRVRPLDHIPFAHLLLGLLVTGYAISNTIIVRILWWRLKTCINSKTFLKKLKKLRNNRCRAGRRQWRTPLGPHGLDSRRRSRPNLVQDRNCRNKQSGRLQHGNKPLSKRRWRTGKIVIIDKCGRKMQLITSCIESLHVYQLCISPFTVQNRDISNCSPSGHDLAMSCLYKYQKSIITLWDFTGKVVNFRWIFI